MLPAPSLLPMAPTPPLLTGLPPLQVFYLKGLPWIAISRSVFIGIMEMCGYTPQQGSLSVRGDAWRGEKLCVCESKSPSYSLIG